MITRIAGYELLVLLRERRILVLLASVLLLGLISLVVLQQEIHRSEQNREAVAQAERDRWLNQGEKDPHSAAHYSIYAFKPSAALAVIEPGVEPYVGKAVWLEAHKQNDLLYRPKGDAGTLQRAGLMNPTAIVTLLAPLLAGVLAFAMVAREREQGTLRFALGTAQQPVKLIHAKTALISVTTIGVLIVPLAIAALMTASLDGALTGDVVRRTAAWSFGLAAYIAVLTLFSMSIALRVADTRVALTSLFAMWVLFAVALPRAASAMAEAAAPLPPTHLIKRQIESEAPAYWGPEVSEARTAELMARYGVSRKEDLPIDERGAQLDMAERHSHAVLDRVLGGFFDRLEDQDRYFAGFGFVSPTIAVQTLTPILAGTDFVHHRDFIQHAEAYRRSLVNQMNNELLVRPLNNGEARYVAGRELWERVPPFTYEAPRLSQAWRDTSVPAIALALWLVVSWVVYLLSARSVRP